MANDENYMLSLADSLWNGYYKSRVAESIAPCVKRKKMTVTTAPNATTGLIGVKEAFSETEAMIPFVATIGNVAVGTTVWVEWTYSASNMIAVSAGTGDTYVVETVENSQGWKNIVTEVTEASGSAGALRLILSNEEQTIFTNEDGSGGDYEQCTTTAYVYYGTQNVSGYATYTFTQMGGVTGSWSDELRRYTATAMTQNTGIVTITAQYVNDSGVTLSASKAFTIKKSLTNASSRVYYVKPQWIALTATDNVTQYKYIVTSDLATGRYHFTINGDKYWFNVNSNPPTTGDYFIMDLTAMRVRQYKLGASGYTNRQLNTSVISNYGSYLSFLEYTSSRVYDHATITFNAYYKVGAAGTQTAYSGRFVIEETQNGSTWTQKYVSGSNQSAYTYTPTNTAMMIRCSLYMTDGTTLLDRQTVSVLTAATLSYTRSMIEQQADSIALNVTAINDLGDTVETQSSTISAQADKIALVVTESMGENVINAASIVTSINNNGDSSIKLNANRIDFVTDGFSIVNSSQQQTFAVDQSGNVTFGGTLNSASGSLNSPSITGGTISGITINTSTLNGAVGTFSGDLTANTTKFNQLEVVYAPPGFIPQTVCHIGSDRITFSGINATSGIEIGRYPGADDVCIFPSRQGKGNVGLFKSYFAQMKAVTFVNASSIRYKKNVQTLTDADIGNIDLIRPVTYELKNGTDENRFIGIIAEELSDTFPKLVTYESGQPAGIDYARLSVVAIYEIQKLRKRVKELEEKAQ